MGLMGKMAEHREAVLSNQQYVTEVNRGSVNMTVYQQRLNDMWAQGYRVHTVLEQQGNLVTVFERRE